MSERTLRAVLLDVGSTLLTENPSRFAIYAEAASRRGVVIDARAMKVRMSAAHHALPRVLDGAFRYTDPWFEAFIARIFGELGFAGAELEAITAELFERFESAETFVLYPGAREALDALRGAGFSLGVVSNWSARLPLVLAATGLAGCFDTVLCSAIEGVEKPAPELFLRAAERLGVAPAEALHAGDHPELDVAAARAAGMRALLVDHTGAHAAAPERVAGLAELAEHVLTLSSRPDR